jgi:PEP-CTERM motif
MRNLTPCRHRFLRCALVSIVALTFVLTHAAWSTATLLPAGTTLFPAPLGPAPGGPLAAPVLGPLAFTSATFTGTLTSYVFADPGNPIAPGDLTFVYQITNTTPVPGEIDRLTVTSFAGVTANADYSNASGVLAPAYIDRSIGTGATVGFSFAGVPIGPGSLQPGQTSDLLVVYTDAKNYAVTNASVIDGSVTTVHSYAPATNIPEPSTLLLGGLAAIGLVVYSRRRK